MRKGLVLSLIALGFVGSGFNSSSANAGVFELSGNFSYSSTTYGSGNVQWTRRWGASFGYFFMALSEIEFSLQDILYRTKIDNVQDTTFHDQIYSVDWVQSLAPKSFPVQPYVKAGIGQLNRTATGTYSDGARPSAQVDMVTGILGAGIKIHLTRSFSLKVEGITYLSGGMLSTWQQNVYGSAGIAVYF